MESVIIDEFSKKYGINEARYLVDIFDNQIKKAIHKKNREARNLRLRYKSSEYKLQQYYQLLNIIGDVIEAPSLDLVAISFVEYYKKHEKMKEKLSIH